MEILFERSFSKKPKVSFVLLDWSCRESLHIFHYLNQQNIPRDNYEIIWIEYYNRRSPEIQTWLENCSQQSKPPILDQWIVMDMPETLYYHKHLMYNIGIVLSKGEIVTICDSDAMVRPTFVETIIKSFEEDSNIALHMDEVRNNDQKFHPFDYPSFDEVEDEGAINFKNGTTTGLIDTVDPLHTLNYGACLCARRDDLIAIGGSDEHLDYLGHVCGPYELTFRLRNLGRREFWHPSELLYHVWHPGQAGNGNYVGPHDGMHMSSTALEVVDSGRIQPIVKNKAIRALQEDPTLDPKSLIPQLIDPSCLDKWSYEAMSKSSSFYVWETADLIGSLSHYNIIKHMGCFYGLPQALGAIDLNKKEEREHPDILIADSYKKIRSLIEQNLLKHAENPMDGEHQARRLLKARVFNQIRRISDILKPNFPNDGPAPALLESHRGYNLIEYGENLYGVPFTLGEIDLTAQDSNALPEEIMVAPSQDSVKSLIDQLMNTPEGKIIEEYEYFNIIKWDGLLYGIPQFFGPVDLETVKSEEGSLFPKASTLELLKNRIDQFNHSPGPAPEVHQITDEDLNQSSVLSGPSLEELKNRIDGNIETNTSPELLEERGKYNIVKFKNRFWGIPQILGEVDLIQEKNLNHPSILIADLLEDLKAQVDEAVELSAAPKLLESWNNHNIIKYKNRFWSIPHNLGEVDVTQQDAWDDPSITSADSLEEIKRLIEEKAGMTAAPKLIEEWNNHNIIKYKNRFWGIPLVLGKIDLMKKKNQKNPSIISADTLDDAKSLIDESIALMAAPELIEMRSNFNIVKYKNRFWSIPHALGEADITKQNIRENTSVLSAETLNEAKDQIDQAVGMVEAPKLMEVWNNFNIIKYKNRFWGVPHALGDVDVTKQETLKNPSILCADSLDSIQLQINEEMERQAAPEFLEEFHKHNILKYNKRFWGIPMELGQVDLTRKDQMNHPSIFSTDTLEDLKRKIEVVAGWSAPPEFMGELNGYYLIKYRNWFYGVPQKMGEANLTHK